MPLPFTRAIDPIWKVARYTSAAPTYFSECDNFVDGGVLANNPCEAGLAHLQEFYHNQGTRLSIGCMVSVGTGIYPKKELGPLSAALSGVQSLFRLINSAVSDVNVISSSRKTLKLSICLEREGASAARLTTLYIVPVHFSKFKHVHHA